MRIGENKDEWTEKAEIKRIQYLAVGEDTIARSRRRMSSSSLTSPGIKREFLRALDFQQKGFWYLHPQCPTLIHEWIYLVIQEQMNTPFTLELRYHAYGDNCFLELGEKKEYKMWHWPRNNDIMSDTDHTHKKKTDITCDTHHKTTI